MKKSALVLMALGLLSFGAYGNQYQVEEQEYWDEEDMDARGQSIEEQEEVIADPEDFPAMEDSGKEVSRERQVHGPDIFENDIGAPQDPLEEYPEEPYAY